MLVTGHLLAWTVVLAFSGLPLLAQKPAAPKKPARPALSVAQIERYIAAKRTDKFVAQEVTARGVAVPVSADMVEGLKRKGAGPETLAALNALIPRASLLVRTTPGAQITIDGAPVGTAAADGTLRLEDLDPGRHRIYILKEDHRARSHETVLAAKTTNEENLPLEWAVGHLTVKVPADASVDLIGQTFKGGVNRLKLPVGQQRISVSAPYYKRYEAVVDVTGGEVTTHAPKLEVDETALHALLKEAAADQMAARHGLARDKAKTVLGFLKEDKNALQIVAAADFNLGNADFLEAALHALRAGTRLSFAVSHAHGRRGHPASITVEKTGLTYEPQGECNLKTFQTPAAGSEITAVSKGPGEFELNVPNPQSKGKRLKLAFRNPGTAPPMIQALCTVINSLSDGSLK